MKREKLLRTVHAKQPKNAPSEALQHQIH